MRGVFSFQSSRSATREEYMEGKAFDELRWAETANTVCFNFVVHVGPFNKLWAKRKYSRLLLKALKI